MANFTTQKSNSSTYATSTKKKGTNFQFNQKNSQKMLEQNNVRLQKGCDGRHAMDGHGDNGSNSRKHCSTQESGRNSKKGNYKSSLRSQRPSVTVTTEESRQDLSLPDKSVKALKTASNTHCHVSSHSLHQAISKSQYIKIESQRYKENKGIRIEGQ